MLQDITKMFSVPPSHQLTDITSIPMEAESRQSIVIEDVVCVDIAAAYNAGTRALRATQDRG